MRKRDAAAVEAPRADPLVCAIRSAIDETDDNLVRDWLVALLVGDPAPNADVAG